jgi:hypothetical protein
MIHNIDMIVPIVITNGIVDIGPEIPSDGKTTFIKAPVNINVAMLNPTVYNKVSIFPISCIFRILRRITPGTNVIYMNPTSCLAIGI